MEHCSEHTRNSERIARMEEICEAMKDAVEDLFTKNSKANEQFNQLNLNIMSIQKDMATGFASQRIQLDELKEVIDKRNDTTSKLISEIKNDHSTMVAEIRKNRIVFENRLIELEKFNWFRSKMTWVRDNLPWFILDGIMFLFVVILFLNWVDIGTVLRKVFLK